jgi:hypothetical protein
VTPGEKRGAPWLLFWTAILGFAMSLVADIALERKNARLTRALAARPAAADTVYLERYWGMEYWTTKPGGRLVVEFSPVETKPAPAGARRK